MRLVALAATIFVLSTSFALSPMLPALRAELADHGADRDDDRRNGRGRQIFRFDTLGDEQLWTDTAQRVRRLGCR